MNQEPTTMSADCVFCQIVQGRAPAKTVYEDHDTLAFMDIHPQGPGHVLVIPKTHVPMLYELDHDTASALAQTLVHVGRGIRQALKPSGLLVQQSNGRSAGQEIMHLHFHLIPRDVEGVPSGRTEEERAELAQQIRDGIAADNQD